MPKKSKNQFQFLGFCAYYRRMHITWQGNYTVKIQAEDKTLVLDPHAPAAGLPSAYTKPDVIALTNPVDAATSNLKGMSEEAEIIQSPGEYELSGFSCLALGWYDGSGNERTLQRWNIDGMVLLHLGELNRELTPGELQELEKTDIDILLLPVGGAGGLSAKQAVSLLTTIEPRVVIPINFAVSKKEAPLETIDTFAKEMGLETPYAFEKKVILKAKKLPQEDLQTILLSPSS